MEIREGGIDGKFEQGGMDVDSMWIRTQSSCEKSIVNALPKVVGFLRVLRFPPTGKVDWVG